MVFSHQKGAIGSLYESAKVSELNRTGIRDHVLSDGPPTEEEKTGLFVSKNILGRAINEVDPFVFEDTFCVISKKFVKHYVYRFSASRALFIFGPLNSMRRFCVFVVTHQLFDMFIILAIVANCIALAFDNNEIIKLTNNSTGEIYYGTVEYDLPDGVELSFLAIYTFEMLLKIIAKGFLLNKFSYLRSGWNILDFIVVMCGFLTVILSKGIIPFFVIDKDDLDILRTFRVLRAVKTMSILPGLRMMINALMNAMRQLIEVMALTFFCLCIFALFALEIFMGRLHHVCVLIKGSSESKLKYRSPNIEPILPETPDKHHLWRMWVNNRNNWESRDYPKDEFVPCGNETGARACSSNDNYVCLPDVGINPDYGWTNFDTILGSMLSSFQLVTLDYWERLYELVMSTFGPWSLPFFVMVVFLGSFYLMNLMLAVVAMSYDVEARSWEQKPLTKYQKLELHRNDSTFSFADPKLLNVTLMTQFKKRTPYERETLARTLRNIPLKQDEGTHDALTQAVMDILGLNLNSQTNLNFKTNKPVRVHVNEEAAAASAAPVVTVTVPDISTEIETEVPEVETKIKNVLLARWRSAALTRAAALEAEISEVDEHRDEDNFMESTQTIEEKNTDNNSETTRTVSESIIFETDWETEDSDLDEYRFDDDDDEDEETGDGISSKYSEAAVSGAGDDMIDDIDQYSNSTASSETDDDDGIGMNRVALIVRGMGILKRELSVYVNTSYLECFVTSCIVLNTILLSTEHDEQPDWLSETSVLGGYLFTSVYTYECTFKIFIQQGDYFNVNWNVFDLFIVSCSILDISVEGEFLGLRGLSSAIRGFRLLRIFKLAQSWLTMKILMNIIFSTFGALGNLTLVLAIVIYVFAILGMQIIGYTYIPRNFGAVDDHDDAFPRWNFSNFGYAFMIVFRVLCGEWIELLWDCLKAHHMSGGEWRCFIIFLPILVLGNFIVLNLFLALLLNSFNAEELNAQREKEKENSGRVDSLKKVVGLLLNKSKKQKKGKNFKFSIGSRTSEKPVNPVLTKFKKAGQKVIAQNRRIVAEKAILKAEKSIKKLENEFHKNPMLRLSLFQVDRKKSYSGSKIIQEDQPIMKPCFPRVCFGRKLNCFQTSKSNRWTRWNSCRKWCLKCTTNPFFEWGILALIFGSSITLCFEDKYFDANPSLKIIVFYLNSAFTLCFIIEMLLKIMAIGLHEYFTTAWTVLDAFIVVVAIVSFVIEFQMMDETHVPSSKASKISGGLSSLKVLRTLRALRPLRAISRWQGMKVVVNALLSAIPSIFNVLLVCLLFWLLFAIMGVQLFKGKFYKCIFDGNGSTVPQKMVKNKNQCCNTEHSGISWINTTPNFDNVFQSYLSLFQVATFEGWMESMRAATDIDPDHVNNQSARDKSFGNYAFFVIFIICGSFFTLNLFIGVIIENFNMLKKKYEGNLLEVLLSQSQRRYYRAMKKLGSKKPRRLISRPKNKFLCLFHDIANSRRFEMTIFVIIFLNMVVMAVESHNQRNIYVHILRGCSTFFSVIYTLEATIKILGLRQHYFTIPWNVFDFCLVIFSIFDLFVGDFNLPFPPALLRVVRIFRIGRVLRLIKAAKGIRRLLFALIVSLPALFNIGALLALITFIYAILGMSLFKDAVSNNNAIDSVFSFETFAKSSLMLFRLMTAGGWNDVLDSLYVEHPICGNYRKIECGNDDLGEPPCINPLIAVLYMVSFLIITYLIVINMYIAIILDNFDEAHRDEEIGIVEDDLEMFYARWSRYDPTASQFIQFDKLSEFLATLDPPLDLPKPNLVAIVAFNLPIARGNKIHCLDVLHALVKQVLGQVDDSDEFRKIQQQMDHKFRKVFPSRKLLDIVSSTRVWKIQHNASLIIQTAWRKYTKRKIPSPEKVKLMQVPGFGNPQGFRKNAMGQIFQLDIGRHRRSTFQNQSV